MSIFKQLESNSGLPEDQLRMVTGFLLAIPMGFLFQQLSGRTLRVLVSTTIGLCFTYMVYQEQILNVLIQSVVVYLMVKCLGKNCAIPVFLETLIYVSAHHIYRQYSDYGGWSLDVTTILMMNTCKWTSFAWCIHDGFQKKEDLSEEQKQRQITKVPSFIDFLGYMFFYAGCLAGPAFDYYEYDEFMDKKGVYTSLPSQGIILVETLKKLRNAIIASCLMLLGAAYLPLDYLTSEDFSSKNFIYKMIWMNIALTLYRMKYLSGWSFAEAGMAASGFTFDGYHQLQPDTERAAKFDRIQCVDIFVDFSYNIAEKVKQWNISVQLWLKRYVYLRVYSEKQLKGNASRQFQAQMVTYMISAFWHGFYPGYYIAFFFWGLMTTVTRFAYKASVNTKTFSIFDVNVVAGFLRFFFVNYLFNGIGCNFVLLSLEKGRMYNDAVYWTPIIITVLAYGFFAATGYGQRAVKSSKKE